MSNNTAIFIYVLVSLLTIGVLSGFLLNCNNKSYSLYKPLVLNPKQSSLSTLGNYNYNTDGEYKPRDMCLCSGGGNKLCANRDQLLDSYNEGNTEYQDFVGTQKLMGGPYWHSTDFNNY